MASATPTLLLIVLLALQGVTAQDTETDLINMVFGQECPPENETVWYVGTQQCEPLLKANAGNCGDGHWLVMSDEPDSKPKCARMPCPTDKMVPVRTRNGTEQCFKFKDTPPCPEGMHVVPLETGKGVCDCQSEHVYHQQRDSVTRTMQGKCYRLFTRGPCPPRQILHLRPGEHEARCRLNVCPADKINVQITQDGEVLLPLGLPRKRCMALFELCGTPSDTMLAINITTNRLECQPMGMGMGLASRVLIDAPLLNCAPGSRRDALGRCRRSV